VLRNPTCLFVGKADAWADGSTEGNSTASFTIVGTGETEGGSVLVGRGAPENGTKPTGFIESDVDNCGDGVALGSEDAYDQGVIDDSMDGRANG